MHVVRLAEEMSNKNKKTSRERKTINGQIS